MRYAILRMRSNNPILLNSCYVDCVCTCLTFIELSAQDASTNRNVTRLTQQSTGKHPVLPPKFPHYTSMWHGN